MLRFYLSPLSYCPRRSYFAMATQLPTLKETEQLSPRVIRILGGNPSKVVMHTP